MFAKIQKIDKGYGVRLPKAVLKELSLKENDTVEIEADDDTIYITRRLTKKELSDRDLNKSKIDEQFKKFKFRAPTVREL